MFILQNISYTHSDGEILFNNINLSINKKEKIAIIGNNGAGKTTLLKIISSQVNPTGGTVITPSQPYYIPQIIGQFDHLTIAQAIGINQKLTAFHEILSGNITEENLAILNDDWTIEERTREALHFWNLNIIDLNTQIKNLSGGQKTKTFLSGIQINSPQTILLDEPTNHLDQKTIEKLYQFISETHSTIAVATHDRILLNKLEKMCELGRHGIKTYGGNYDFYTEQIKLQHHILISDLEEKQKSLRKAKQTEHDTIERQQKRESQGKKNLNKNNIATILAGTRKSNSENNTARLKSIHSDKVTTLSQELKDLQSQIPDNDKMKFGFDTSSLHKGKILVKASAINYSYNENQLWQSPLSFQITSGEKISIKGNNGSGKTTLLKLILGIIQPTSGKITHAENNYIYIDQDYSLINNKHTVYRQAEIFNNTLLQEYEIKNRLNRFLFTKEFWNKPCAVLSGGEKMRLLLCCLTISQQSPDIIILDEPTNNMDIQNMEILTAAINEYQGTIIAVSHDPYFLNQIRINHEIILQDI
jgi:ATPase subunit of ABC transporter with duplicated ATPase domains